MHLLIPNSHPSPPLLATTKLRTGERFLCCLLFFLFFFRNRNELAETLALLKAQIDPVLLKNSSQQDSSSRESPSLEEEETKKEEETTKQGFFCVFCFSLFCNFFSFPLFFPPISIEFPSIWKVLTLPVKGSRFFYHLMKKKKRQKTIEYFGLLYWTFKKFT